MPIWLEVMLVQSTAHESNISDGSISYIIEKIASIHPHEVNLNTCVRPPEEDVDPVSDEKLHEISARMRRELPKIPIIIVPKRTTSRSKLLREDEISTEILRMLSVRPCTPTDLSDSLGINPAEVGKYLARLSERDEISRRVREGRVYYAVDT